LTFPQDPILRDHFWMNPFGVHFSSVTVSKLVLVTPDGYVHPLGAQLPVNVGMFDAVFGLTDATARRLQHPFGDSP
jgi:hypothetical protein